jgi:hypothetical protein
VRANETTISILELKRLAIELKEKQPDICFRYRLMGEMWHPNFLKIIKVHGDGITLDDEVANKLIFINDLSTIMQFELDGRFQSFQPHFHYEVVIRSELHFY